MPDEMKLTTEDGSVLDATFEIDRSVVDVVLHSRSGGGHGGEPSNPDYFPALELMLRRMADAGAVIEDVLVDSTIARRLPISDRRLVLSDPYPIDLSGRSDLIGLRREICAAQRTVAQRKGAKGGNNHKRIRLRIRLPQGFADQWIRYG